MDKKDQIDEFVREVAPAISQLVNDTVEIVCTSIEAGTPVSAIRSNFKIDSEWVKAKLFEAITKALDE